MESLEEQLVVDGFHEYWQSRLNLRDNIDRLTRLAVSDDIGASEPATRALFTGLVERLADSFEPDAVTIYNRAFAQVIQICRHHPRAESLDRELRQFGLNVEEDLVARAEMFRQVARLKTRGKGAGKPALVIVLSRVTLGADVAITSVILERIKREFPGVDIVLLSGSKTAELFGGDPRLRIEEVNYGRAGTTISRLLAWTGLLDRVRALTRGLKDTEYVIVDPDTRLTQLGLLPLTSSARSAVPRRESSEYLFFPSREYGSHTSQSISELTSAWLNEVFGERDQVCPSVSLRHDDLEAARRLVSPGKQSRTLVAINFGVGENPMKRAGDGFEESLVARLICEGARIILDKGAGDDEVRRADALVAEISRIEREGRGVRVVEIDEQRLKRAATGLDADVLVWNGRIGMLAALIAESSLYIGYDSAGQHIAAALGTPCIDVFAGFSSQRFVDRWRPAGKSETRVVALDPGSAANELAKSVSKHAAEMLQIENRT